MSLIFSNQNQNLSDLKRINDSMSEKIKQNRKQKNLFQNNNIASNITSGINTEKRMEYKNYLEEFNAMNNADVSTLDGKTVLTLIVAASRTDHLCEGALQVFVRAGCIKRWLMRLKAIDEEKSKIDTMNQRKKKVFP